MQQEKREVLGTLDILTINISMFSIFKGFSVPIIII
jgi:hypothetical protein